MNYDHEPYIPVTYFSELEGLTAIEKLVYLVIKSFQQGCYLGNKGISLRTEVSVGSVNKALKVLESKEKIKIIERKAVIGGYVNVYKAFTTRTLNTPKSSPHEFLNTSKRSPNELLTSLSVQNMTSKRSPRETRIKENKNISKNEVKKEQINEEIIPL